ncbi:MAG TPA: SUMF1/EgtB/PvdO family nonheme iron enzyme [Nitrospira sp.]|nr:SUMF1/EgtB/PvdO family nonheme iron enzyme [Nitrospira sp.]
MKRIRLTRVIVLAVCVSAGLTAAASVQANEPVAPKQESTPTPVPPSAKPRTQDGEIKPAPKSSAAPSPAESTGKEPPQAKPEPGPGAAPPPSKPRMPEGEAKPPAKSQHPANGAAASKPATVQFPAEITGKDGVPMVLVPVGEFTMGSDKGDDDEQPVHRAFLDSFYIDKFEVTNGRFAKFVEAIQSEPPWGFADKETPVLHPDQPVRWVNWMDATGYCLWAGKRLPTEAEWEKAARGTDGRNYPWGNDPPTPAHAVFGLKEGADTVSSIGNRDKGKSPYGVHDMAGNLYEWTADWYDEEFYLKNPAINPRGPAEGTAKVQRGGSYTNTPYRLRSTFRTKGDPTEHDPNVGFRCAQDAPKQP